MAYLARRRDTFVMRLLLLPTVIFLSVRSAYGFVLPSTSRALLLTSWGLQVLLAPAVVPGIQLGAEFVIALRSV